MPELPYLPIEVWEKFIKDAQWAIDYHTQKLTEAQAQLRAGQIALEQSIAANADTSETA